MMKPVKIFLTFMIVATIMIGGALLLFASQAKAQTPHTAECGPAKGFLARLEHTFHERQVFSGLINEERGIFTILTLADKGNWSLLVCEKDVCCLKAAGEKSNFLGGA